MPRAKGRIPVRHTGEAWRRGMLPVVLLLVLSAAPVAQASALPSSSRVHDGDGWTPSEVTRERLALAHKLRYGPSSPPPVPVRPLSRTPAVEGSPPAVEVSAEAVAAAAAMPAAMAPASPPPRHRRMSSSPSPPFTLPHICDATYALVFFANQLSGSQYQLTIGQPADGLAPAGLYEISAWARVSADYNGGSNHFLHSRWWDSTCPGREYACEAGTTASPRVGMSGNGWPSGSMQSTRLSGLISSSAIHSVILEGRLQLPTSRLLTLLRDSHF